MSAFENESREANSRAPGRITVLGRSIQGLARPRGGVQDALTSPASREISIFLTAVDLAYTIAGVSAKHFNFRVTRSAATTVAELDAGEEAQETNAQASRTNKKSTRRQRSSGSSGNCHLTRISRRQTPDISSDFRAVAAGWSGASYPFVVRCFDHTVTQTEHQEEFNAHRLRGISLHRKPWWSNGMC